MIARDITEQKRSEGKLAQARRDIDRFFGLSPDVMAIANGEGRFVPSEPRVRAHARILDQGPKRETIR